MEGNFIDISGRIIRDESYAKLVEDFNALDNPTEVTFRIASEGGHILEGNKMYDFMVGLDIPVTTITDYAYSIASKFPLAGDPDKRLMLSKTSSIMIHLPLYQNITGGAEFLQRCVDHLNELEQVFVDFYVANTNLDEETVRNYLNDGDTFCGYQDSKKWGFIDVIVSTTIENNIENLQLKAVAVYDFNINNEFNMNKEDAIAQLVVTDIEGNNYTFADLGEADKPMPKDGETKGSIAKDKDDKAPNGDIEMSTGEVYTFNKGELTAVTAKKEDSTIDEVEDAPEGAEATEIKEIYTWKTGVTNTEFKLKDVVTYEVAEDAPEGEKPHTISAGEYELEDGRKILCDSDGVIQFIKEAPVEAPIEDAVNLKMSKQLEANAEAIAQLTALIEGQNAEIAQLKRATGSVRLDVQNVNTNPTTNTKKPSAIVALGNLRNS